MTLQKVTEGCLQKVAYKRLLTEGYLTWLIPHSSQRGHRASTAVRHLVLFLALCLASPQVMPILSKSLCSPRRQVFLGRPLFLLPCGFQSRAERAMLCSFLKVCPIHFHRLLLMLTWTGSWPVLCHKSRSEIFSGHWIPSICRKHLLKKTCTCLIRALVSLQVSEPYRRTDLTFQLNILSFVLVRSDLQLQIGRSIAKACCAFFLLAFMSSSVPPVGLTMLPRYVNSFTSSIACPLSMMLLFRQALTLIVLVLLTLIFNPARNPVDRRWSSCSWASCNRWASMQMSSAKSRSSNLFVSVHRIPRACWRLSWWPNQWQLGTIMVIVNSLVLPQLKLWMAQLLTRYESPGSWSLDKTA